jgi:hypothetical protein
LLATKSTEAICEAAHRFMSGHVKRNLGFPPRTDEVCAEVDRIEEHHRLLAEREQRMRLPATTRSFGNGASPFEKLTRDVRHEMRGRPILARAVSLEKFKADRFPTDAQWEPIDGNVYGPKEGAAC